MSEVRQRKGAKPSKPEGAAEVARPASDPDQEFPPRHDEIFVKTSILKRPVDLFFVGFFAFALFFAITLDCINVLMPAGKITPQGLNKLIWPPAFMKDLFMFWCEYADPWLLQNPLWYKVICGLSPFLYAPFYVAAIYAFIHELEWIRPWCLAYSGSLFFSMIPVWVYSLTGDTASPRPLVFISAYGPFLLLPILLFIRMSREAFPRPRSARRQAFIVRESIFYRLDDLMFVLYFFFALYIAAWLDVIPFLVEDGLMRKETILSLEWPPSEHIRRMYYSWMHDVDHVALRNPLWFRIFIGYKIVVYVPFYIFSIYAMIRQRIWIQPWMLLWVGAIFGTYIPIFFENFDNPIKPQPALYFAINGVPVGMAVMIFVRMRDYAFESFDPPHVDWIKRS